MPRLDEVLKSRNTKGPLGPPSGSTTLDRSSAPCHFPSATVFMVYTTTFVRTNPASQFEKRTITTPTVPSPWPSWWGLGPVIPPLSTNSDPPPDPSSALSTTSSSSIQELSSASDGAESTSTMTTTTFLSTSMTTSISTSTDTMNPTSTGTATSANTGTMISMSSSTMTSTSTEAKTPTRTNTSTVTSTNMNTMTSTNTNTMTSMSTSTMSSTGTSTIPSMSTSTITSTSTGTTISASTTISTILADSVSTISPPQSTSQNSTILIAPSSHPTEALSKGALSGIVIGSLVALSLVSAFLFCYIRRRRNRNRRGQVQVVSQFIIQTPAGEPAGIRERGILSENVAGSRGFVAEHPSENGSADEDMEDRALLIARNRAFEYGQSDALQQIPSRDTARQTFSSYPCSIDFGSTSAIEMPVDISFGPAAPSSRALPSNEDRRSPISPTSPLSSESLHLPGAPFPIRYQRSLRINTRGRGRKRNEGSWPENIGPVSEYDRPALGRSPSGKVPPAY